MRKGRFELPHPFGYYDLNVARLPFRHSRAYLLLLCDIYHMVRKGRFELPRPFGALRPQRSASAIPPLPHFMVGAPGLEPGTSFLSGMCSNHLSYAPIKGEIKLTGGDERIRTAG